MKKIWVEDISSPFRCYQEESPGVDFLDKTSDIIEWDKSDGVLDWSRRRDIISPLFYSEAGVQLENFSSMSNEIKLLGCKYFLIPYSLRIQLITDSEDKNNWDFLLSETKKSRIECVEAMRIYTGQLIRTGDLSLSQTQSFYTDVHPYVTTFKEANCSEFKMWLFGSTPFENVFSSKDYYTVDIQNKLISIYNGDY